MTRRNALNLLRDPCFALLLAAAFLARALIPTGFMPAPEGLVMCSAFVAGELGASPVATLRSLPTPPPGTETAGHDPCPFALTLGAFASTTAIPALEAVWQVQDLAPGIDSPALQVPGPARTQLPRGPPSQA